MIVLMNLWSIVFKGSGVFEGRRNGFRIKKDIDFIF